MGCPFFFSFFWCLRWDAMGLVFGDFNRMSGLNAAAQLQVVERSLPACLPTRDWVNWWGWLDGPEEIKTPREGSWGREGRWRCCAELGLLCQDLGMDHRVWFNHLLFCACLFYTLCCFLWVQVCPKENKTYIVKVTTHYRDIEHIEWGHLAPLKTRLKCLKLDTHS